MSRNICSAFAEITCTGPSPTFTAGHSGCDCSIERNCPCGRQARRALRHDGFEALHEFFARSSANIARAVIVIVGEHAADFAVLLDARRPVSLMVFLCPILIDAGQRRLFASQMYGFLNVVRIGRMPAVLLLI